MPVPAHRNVLRHDGSTAESWTKVVCGHCGTSVSAAVVASIARHVPPNKIETVHWLLCVECGKGLVLNGDNLAPGSAFGPLIEGLPEDIDRAYQEARDCLKVNAYAASELICRKILMHIAAEKGSPEGGTFAGYIGVLEGLGYVTPPMKPWVNLIKKHGNDSTHKLDPTDKSRSENTLMFTAELLRLVYEMEHLAKKYTN